jgi:hypothetical protein
MEVIKASPGVNCGGAFCLILGLFFVLNFQVSYFFPKFEYYCPQGMILSQHLRSDFHCRLNHCHGIRNQIIGYKL